MSNQDKSYESLLDGDTKNVTCEDPENPNLIRICHVQIAEKYDCVIWNCSICFWGNDSCYNFDVGPRTDCPTQVCVIEPKPTPTPPHIARFVLYPVIGILCVILVGLLLYLGKLVRENRAYRRAQENQTKRFLNAGEALRGARRDNEEAQRILRELAEAANVPLPVPQARPLNELEELANEEVEDPNAIQVADPEEQEEELPPPSHSRHFGVIRSVGRSLANNIQNASRPIRQRMQTRLQLAKQAIRRPRFSRLRESSDSN